MARAIMIQGTMSGVGKSLLTAGLCRIFRQDGYRAAPFKSQNMSLNSFITGEGLEMGRAQVMQAEAAGILPDVRMNPVLLKPTTDTGSQVIVLGEVLGDMDARRYFAYKRSLLPTILDAYRSLAEEYDILVIEGAGSPAEINLKKDDIVNMGLAKAVGAPVLLAGDIDRGGVFAQLLGTQMLLEPDEQALLKGLIINKFRGDRTILDPGIRMLEARAGIPVVGVVPYMQLDLDDEDSLSPQLDRTNRPPAGKPVEIAVIRLPHMSNFTDFNVFARIPEVDLRYVSRPGALAPGKEAAPSGSGGAGASPAGCGGGRGSVHMPDMILLPGTKNTMGDLAWLRESGMAAAIDACLRRGSVLFGICGGYQMLGQRIEDPLGTETGGSARGLGYLAQVTVFSGKKRRTRVRGRVLELPGALRALGGMEIEGYEIHMGRTTAACGGPAGGTRGLSEQMAGLTPFSRIEDLQAGRAAMDGAACGDVYGTYVHGVFDAPGVAWRIAQSLAEKKGLRLSPAYALGMGPQAYKEAQYEALAETLRRHLDLEAVYRILEGQ